MAPPKRKTPTTTRARAGSKSPDGSVGKSAPSAAGKRGAKAGADSSAEPSGKKQASRRSQATPMLPKVRLTAEVTAGG